MRSWCLFWAGVARVNRRFRVHVTSVPVRFESLEGGKTDHLIADATSRLRQAVCDRVDEPVGADGRASFLVEYLRFDWIHGLE